MQDSENTRKRSRIRTKVQGNSSQHAFSLDHERRGEAPVRVAMVDEDHRSSHKHSTRDDHFNQFVKENTSFSSYSPREDSFDEKTYSQKNDFAIEDRSIHNTRRSTYPPKNPGNNYQDNNRRGYIAERPHTQSRTAEVSRGSRSVRFRRNPAVAPRFGTEQYPSRESMDRDSNSEMIFLNARDIQNERERNKRGEGNRYSAGRKNAHPTNNRGSGSALRKGKKKKVAKFSIQPAPAFTPTYPEENINSTDPIRLNKFLANSGICSRRNADVLIAEGKIKINGEVITTMGKEVTRQDIIEYNGKRVEIEPRVYVLLNKPKNCMTTSDDPEGRITVMDLVKNACKERIYPVGRLDRNTTGVLLLTNDGDMMAKLLHPTFLKKKIYQVTLDRPVEVEHMQQIAQGVELSDGEIHADAISYVDEEDFSIVGIEIHSGRNRIVRRIFEHFGYKIYKLDRVYFAGLTKKDLPRGRWRYLTEEEVIRLRMGNYE